MNTLQKQAVCNLIMIAWIFPFTALLTLMCVKVFGREVSVELVTRNFVMCTYAVLIGTAINTSKVFRMRKEGKNVYFDERDQLINYRAVLRVYYVICIFLVVGFVLSLGFWDESIGSIPFYFLPVLLGVISLLVVLVYSISILVQYSCEGKGEKKRISINKTQKQALVVLGLTFLLLPFIVDSFAGTLSVERKPPGSDWLWFLLIFALMGAPAFFFGKKQGTARPALDERGRVIKRRAALAGFTASCLFVILSFMVPFTVLGSKVSISVSWLPHIFGGVFVTYMAVWSVAILVQYGWGGKEN